MPSQRRRPTSMLISMLTLFFLSNCRPCTLARSARRDDLIALFTLFNLLLLLLLACHSNCNFFVGFYPTTFPPCSVAPVAAASSPVGSRPLLLPLHSPFLCDSHPESFSSSSCCCCSRGDNEKGRKRKILLFFKGRQSIYKL